MAVGRFVVTVINIFLYDTELAATVVTWLLQRIKGSKR